MEAIRVFETVCPVFLLAGLGWLLARVKGLEVRTLTEVVVYAGGPCLVFSSLSKGSVPLGEAGVIVSGCLFLVLGVGLVTRLVFMLSGSRPHGYYLPAMFMNAGNMLLPLCLFAFGEDGLARGVIVFATMSVLVSSLGVFLATGSTSAVEMFRLPYVYAAVGGLAVGWYGVEVPPLIERPVELLAGLAIPLMLLALGARLGQGVVESLRKPLLATVSRVGGGYFCALLFVAVADVSGLTRSVLLLASVMPSAVVNFVFAEKYGNDAPEVATTIFVSTMVSLFTTPLVLGFGI
ncbi:MAG: AEC family transporter [Candidatus Binatia bacterium]